MIGTRPEPLSIRSGRPADLSAITEITDAEFGAGYYLRRQHERIFAPESGVLCLVAVNTSGRVVGYTIDVVTDAAGLRGEFHIPPPPAGQLFGVLKMTAVHRDYQRRGIGRALTDAALTYFAQLGVDGVCSSAWVDPSQGTAPYGPSLTRHGFVAVDEVADFWRAESLAHPQFPCSVCGADCRCSAAIFWRNGSTA